MTLAVHHVHVKTRDPKGTTQFYIDNFGATLIQDRGARGTQVSLHGLQLNITPIMRNRLTFTGSTLRPRARADKAAIADKIAPSPYAHARIDDWTTARDWILARLAENIPAPAPITA